MCGCPVGGSRLPHARRPAAADASAGAHTNAHAHHTHHADAYAAGFDAHKKDEINFRYIGVTERDYEWLTEQLVAVANRCAGGCRGGGGGAEGGEQGAGGSRLEGWLGLETRRRPCGRMRAGG